MQTVNVKKTVLIKATGAPASLQVTGTYFICTAATAGLFQMSFDGSTFFDFQKGLTLGPFEKPFQRLVFQPYPNTKADNTIEFFYGNLPVKDSRLNVVDVGPSLSVWSRSAADFFYVPIYSGSMGNATTKDAPGTFTDISQVVCNARSLVVQHYTASKYLTLQWNDPVAGATTLCRIPANQPFEYIYGNNVGVTGFPTPALINFKIANSSGGAIDCDIYQTIWNP